MEKKKPNPSRKPIEYSLAKESPPNYLWECFSSVPALPEINYFGYRDTKDAQVLTKHQHPSSFEFVYIEKGKASWEINGSHYETKAGDVFHTKPGEVHGGSFNIIEPCRLWAFMLRAPIHFSDEGLEYHWLQQNPEEIELLINGLYRLPRVSSLGYSALVPFRRLAKAIQKPGKHSRLTGTVAALDFLLQLLEKSQIEEGKTDSVLWKIERLTNELVLRLDRLPRVEELAERVGVSPAYFYRMFQKQIHMTPKTYLERLRIKEACRLLTESDTPIMDIAMDLGFATSQHFATVFRRLTGRTPSEWRQNKFTVDMERWIKEYRNDKFNVIALPDSFEP